VADPRSGDEGSVKEMAQTLSGLTGALADLLWPLERS
jgi:hypothetical protein